MAVDSVFACGFTDCLFPCFVTFFITLIVMTIIHIVIYFQLVKLAKRRYGIEGFEGYSPQSYQQISHLLVHSS